MTTAQSHLRPRRKSKLGELPNDRGVSLSTLSPEPTPHTKRNQSTLLTRYKKLSLQHTWLNPLLACLLTITLCLLNPTPNNPLHACLFISYPVPNTNQYAKGPRDLAFIAFYTIVFTFAREFLMKCLIQPLARRAGIPRSKQSRFMEQFYTAIYTSISGPAGLWIMYTSPLWYFDTTAMYTDFPHKTHTLPFKAYYLLQASFWAQQVLVLVLMLEKPRKDFREFVAHHVVTVALVGLSYRCHFMSVGLGVFVSHDVSDFFLATSKLLNYLNHPFITVHFFVFVIVWVYMRHYLNLRILYSVATEFATVGPYELNWETEQYKCWISQWITFGLLGALQALNAFWTVLVGRVAWRWVSSWGRVKKDERSDDEDEDGE